MAMHWLFPTPVLQVDLEPDAATAPPLPRNAQLSSVFYVLTDPANESGELEFEAPDDYFSHVMAIPYRDAAVSGGVFAPLPHSLLLFPSDLRHRVLPYEASSPRYSVSYDLAITTAPGKGREMPIPHPMDLVSTGSNGLGLRQSRQPGSTHERRVRF